MYTSTLRIGSLSNTRDNDAMYSCSVSVLLSPVSSYITLNVAGIILNCTYSNSSIVIDFINFSADS